MFRFIHAADIHLDSPLVGLSRYEGAPVAQLRAATRSAFTRLVDFAIGEAVDFMVIAGDLYDGDWRDYNTGLYFAKEMGRLHDAGIPVFVLHGNHDAKSEITKQLKLPPNVHVFSDRQPRTFELEHLNVALHGQSFRTPETTENLAAAYPAPVPGWTNIGVLHTALEGHAAHASYAPCAIAELVARGYDYWALGHVHEHAVRHERPWIVYPGNLQGRHARETGERGAVLVTADAEGFQLSRCCTDVVRWHRLEIDAADAQGLDDVVERAGRLLESLAQEHLQARALAVRVAVRGRSRAHGKLFGLENQLRHDILAQANAIGGDALWIEKVCIETLPTLSAEELLARSDALADLQQLLDKAPGDPAFMEALQSDLLELVARCPAEVIEAVEPLGSVQQGRVRELVESVAPSLVARLASED